jgi:magnesium chelatase subunit D
MNVHHYPFSAIVEQNAMKMALVLNAVDPSISGVLIRGHKGTGKSTAARALAQLLPDIEVVEHCPFNSDSRNPVDPAALDPERFSRNTEHRSVSRPMPFVELPLNTTEDRLAGSLQIETALQAGKLRFEPGLLAAANRGILYVDEVNLLEDHLVDLLLDSAASGVNVVEREGVSFAHPSRFILVGTMNPEEGELRPQFLDRFGLCVVVDTVSSPESRETLVRRRLAFESEPGEFIAEWRSADRVIAKQIVAARARLGGVVIPDDLLGRAVRFTQALALQGHRADITILKAARAHAALLDKPAVDAADLAEAARLAVPHRLRVSPLDSPGAVNDRIDRALREGGVARDLPAPQDDGPDPVDLAEEMAEQMQVPGAMAAGSILFSFLERKQRETVFEPHPDIVAEAVELNGVLRTDKPARAVSTATVTGRRRGRFRRSVPVAPGEQGFDLAVQATLRQASVRRAAAGSTDAGAPVANREDFRKKEYVLPAGHLIVFVVDASDSMRAGLEARMRAAKGAVLAILRRAYENRSKVALVAFSGTEARVVLPPTSSVEMARPLLEQLPTGGATPFADGLDRAWRLIRSERLKSPELKPVLLIVSDGEANVPLRPGVPAMDELAALASKIAADGIPAVFVDAAAQPGKISPMERIAAQMAASYVPIQNLTAPSLLKAVREAGL